MAKFYSVLNDDLTAFIRKQHMFFVATAAQEGRINLSPKGMDTFRILSPHLVGYLDLTGSGAETGAHIIADGRITIMFCSFDAKPLILRLYGHGEIIHLDHERWAELSPQFSPLPGMRQVILLHIESLQTSCGFAVPRYELIEHRQALVDFAKNKGECALEEYRAEKNQVSIDGFKTGL